MSVRIGVISDTHDLLRAEAVEQLKTCEVILHGGDIGSQELLSELTAIAPVYAVRGNCDGDWAEHLPESLEFELHGKRFFMTHRKKDIPKDVKADVVVFGHSHKFAGYRKDGILYLNPGSCGPRRFHQPVTMSFLVLEEGDGQKGLGVERLELSHIQKEAEAELANVTAGLVRKVCTDTDRGRSVCEIAAKRSMDVGIAEQIVRMYVTHPGVTPEQIMAKMGL